MVFVYVLRAVRLGQGFTQRLPLKPQNYIQLTYFHHDWRPDKHLHLSSSCCGGVAQTVSQPPAPNLCSESPNLLQMQRWHAFLSILHPHIFPIFFFSFSPSWYLCRLLVSDRDFLTHCCSCVCASYFIAADKINKPTKYSTPCNRSNPGRQRHPLVSQSFRGLVLFCLCVSHST